MQVLPGIIAKNRGDVETAERLLREVVDAQRQIARETGSEQPFACWPLMAWGAVAHLIRDLPVAMARYQASLAHAWRHQEARCGAYALTRVASILAMSGRWREGACDRRRSLLQQRHRVPIRQGVAGQPGEEAQ
jgi:hypothetical protein